MFSYKDVGKLIVSESTQSLDWKINFSRCIANNCKFTFISPSFRYKHESLKISLQGDVEKDVAMMQVVRANDVTCATNLVHGRFIKIEGGGVYDALGFESTDTIFTWSIENFKNYNKNGYTSFTVNFQEEGISTDYETSHLKQVPDNSSGSRSMYVQTEIKGRDILSKNLKILFLTETLSDFNINVGDRKFKVHKAILAAQSKVFAAMMKHDLAEKETNEVDIDDCDPGAFHEFLQYLYSGQAETISDGNVTALYKIADKYGVLDLKEVCVNYMKSSLSVDMFCSFIELASKHDEKELLELSKAFFASNAKNILSSTNWETFLNENATLARELYLLLVPDN